MSGPASESLSDVRSRLGWARAQIAKCELATDEFLAVCPCQQSVVETIEWREPYYIRVVTHTARASKPVPIELRLMAGEAIHALRASLDNLIWGLGSRCGTRKSACLFFVETPKEYQARAESMKLTKLPPDIQNWIESQQVYAQSDRVPSLLHSLNRLWNEDKHRAPAIVSNTTPTTYLGPRMVGQIDLLVADVSANGDTVIRTEGAGELNPEFKIELRFPDLRTEVVAFLRAACDHIGDDVIPRFEPHFR